jgi:hypothetical protein
MQSRWSFLAAVLASAPAVAGNVAAGPMSSPSGAFVVPVIATHDAAASPVPGDTYVATEAGIQRDCLVVDGQVLSCFGVPAEMARINRHAKLMAKADPTPTACQAHVRFVRELARRYDVYAVTSAMGGWENHTSALVIAGDRSFLLDNGALREAGVWGREGATPYDWSEVTGLDRSGWHLEKLTLATP